MEWIGMRKLARASSLSDVSNVVYFSDEYRASFMNFPKMQYCTMQVTLLNIIHSLRFNMSYMIISAEHYAAAGNQLHKLRSQAQGCCFHHRLHSRPSSIIFLLLCSKLKVKILEKSSYTWLWIYFAHNLAYNPWQFVWWWGKFKFLEKYYNAELKIKVYSGSLKTINSSEK